MDEPFLGEAVTPLPPSEEGLSFLLGDRADEFAWAFAHHDAVMGRIARLNEQLFSVAPELAPLKPELDHHVFTVAVVTIARLIDDGILRLTEGPPCE